MKEAFWGYFIISLGLFIIVILLLVQRLTVTNEEDFYLTREVLEAAMIDAVDYGSYRLTGRVIMSEEKFEEVFIRRFAESVTNNKAYTIEFYDIYEDPPKATVRIRTSSGTTVLNSDSFGISVDTILSGILETKEAISAEPIPIPEAPEISVQETIDVDFTDKTEGVYIDDICYDSKGNFISDEYCNAQKAAYEKAQEINGGTTGGNREQIAD